mgnify:CR=1 FL=1
MPSPERPPQESAPKQPIRTLLAAEVRIGDAEQMAHIIGGEPSLDDRDFYDVPYLENHALGIRVRFGEGFPDDSNPVTTISAKPLSSSPLLVESLVGDVVFEEARVDIFDDSIVICQIGYVGQIAEGPNIVDQVTITREGHKFERKTLPL